MQVLEIFPPYPDRFAAFIEIVDIHDELFVGPLVVGVPGTGNSPACLFLKLEMRLGVGFQEIDQMDQNSEFLGFAGGLR